MARDEVSTELGVPLVMLERDQPPTAEPTQRQAQPDRRRAAAALDRERRRLAPDRVDDDAQQVR